MRYWTHSISCRYTFVDFFSSLLERPAGLRQKIRGFMAQI
jgi:hypothetical protein